MDKELNEVESNDVDNSFNLDEEVHRCQWGGIPFCYSLGDTNQLAPVAKRASYDHRQPKPGAHRLGKIAFFNFLHTTDPHESMATIVFMDDVVRQTDTRFKDLLQNMRQDRMNDDDINLIVGRVLENMTTEEKWNFQLEGLHLVPTWKQASAINLDYLMTELQSPIANYVVNMNTSRSDGKNCCLRECSFPLCSLLCVDAKVMLLVNYIVEYKLMNSSVGVVKQLCFSNPEGG